LLITKHEGSSDRSGNTARTTYYKVAHSPEAVVTARYQVKLRARFKIARSRKIVISIYNNNNKHICKAL